MSVGCSSPLSSAVTPSTASAAAGATWCLPVLGDACRGGSVTSGSIGSARRSTSASAAVGARKSTAVRLPRSPRPARTRQTFLGVKKGIQECLRLVEDEITRLRNEDLASSPSSCQSRIIEVEKLLKQAERHKKRFEFHLFKLEELEDSYVLHQQLREGVKNMAKAYISHPGSSKRMSMQNVERGHRECIQTMCALEAQLESLLGTFHCTMAGLAGFARLVPGDTCEMILRYGSQKWKCRGKIGDKSQTWEPKSVSLKAIIGDELLIKVAEVKSLGKNTPIGEKNCDTLEMFRAQPHAHSFSLNASGSVKLTLITHWLPLDGADEGLASYDVHRRTLATPRRQVPVMSMIEGNSQQFLYWQKHNLTPADDSVSTVSRHSVPVFPSSCDADTSPTKNGDTSDPRQDLVYHRHRQHQQQLQPTQSADEADARRYPYINRTRPHSVCVPSSVGRRYGSPSLTDSSAVSSTRRSMSMESLCVPRLQFRSSMPLDSAVSDLRTALASLMGRFPQLAALATQVDRIGELLWKSTQLSSARRCSEESNSIETVLEAFSFLESVDYECEVSKEEEGDSSTNEFLIFDESVEDRLNCAHRDFGVNSTMTTTDSGIGSIANRATKERRSRFDSRLIGSRGLAQLPVAVVQPMPGVGGADVDQLEVALRWHVSYCGALIKSVNPPELHTGDDSYAITELGRQTSVFQELFDIGDSEKNCHFSKLPCVESASERLVEFWTRCCDESLFCVDTSFLSELFERCSASLASKHGILHPSTVCQELLSRLVGEKLFRCLTNCNNDELGFLTQTITLHRYFDFFKRSGHSSVEEYVDHVATECGKKLSLPDIVRKNNE